MLIFTQMEGVIKLVVILLSLVSCKIFFMADGKVCATIVEHLDFLSIRWFELAFSVPSTVITIKNFCEENVLIVDKMAQIVATWVTMRIFLQVEERCT